MTKDIFRKTHFMPDATVTEIVLQFKEKAEELYELFKPFKHFHKGIREFEIAKTKLEECVMWFVKGATHPCEAEKIIEKKEEEISSTIKEIFRYWQVAMSKPKAKLDGKRKNKIRKALNIYTPENLKKAIDGCKNSDYHMGRDKNSYGKKYNDIELILRDSPHIERFIELAINTDEYGQPVADIDYEKLISGAINL